MNGDKASAIALLAGLKSGAAEVSGCDIAVCPAAVHIALAADALAGTNIAWGGQDLCVYAGPGAYTGEVSADMLVDLRCTFVITGHSERRSLFGETDDVVAQKTLLASRHGLVPIVCVGESLEEREGGVTESVIDRQMSALLDVEGGIEALAKGCVVAYEPVWAIGTGLTATPEQAQAVHAFIRGLIAKRDAEVASAVRILYGGSVKPDNAASIFAEEDIDGGLIGGASLDAASFLEICRGAV